MKDQRHTGVLLVLISALAFSTVGLFVRYADTDLWSILFWRGIAAAGLTLVYLNFRGTLARECRMGKAGLIASLIGGASSVAFIAAFQNTTIANVSLIYAIAPFVAAFLMWVWVRELPSVSIMMWSGLAFVGVGIVVSDSLGTTYLLGDLLALLMTIGMSLYLCFYRRYPDLPSAGPAILSQLWIAPLCLHWGDPFDQTLSQIGIIVALGGVFTLAAITLAEGTRRLPVSEATLISSLETPLAPLLAFILLAETPTARAIGGGLLIITAILASQVLPIRNRRSSR